MAMTTQQDEGSSLGNDAYDWLLTAITSFRLPANAPLSESRLAEQIGVSRTPVREALRRLESEGLVRRGENNRITVSLLTRKELDEACDLLILLDTYLFTRAAEVMSGEQRAQLAQRAGDMIAAAARGDAEAWAQADRSFHELILIAADNQTAADVARVTRRRIQRFWNRSLSTSTRLGSCSEEHRVIAEAMERRRSDDVARAVADHIEHMRSSVGEILAVTSTVLGGEVSGDG
jgi:DNA-binding GntR family transcriptional regulator